MNSTGGLLAALTIKVRSLSMGRVVPCFMPPPFRYVRVHSLLITLCVTFRPTRREYPKVGA